MRRLVALLPVAAVVALIAALAGGGEDGTLVRAEFANASGLREGSPVRVSGVRVGTVDRIRITARDNAAVEMRIDETTGAGATAAIRSANLLGEKFVDLALGDRARPRSTIPLARTSTPVDVDDVLDVLDPTTRGRLALLIGESGIALSGRGHDLARALRGAPRTVHDASALIAEIGADTDVLERLIAESDRVVAVTARERRALGTLVETGAAALQVPAARRAQLGATLREAPAALAQLRRSLRLLDRTGAALRPAARGLQATAPALRDTLRALPGFDAAAGPALQTVARVAPSLTRLGRQATPSLRRLRPTAVTLGDLAGDADALLARLDASSADILGTAENWARAIQQRDGVGHQFRTSLSLTPDVLRHLRAYVRGQIKLPALGGRPPALDVPNADLPATAKDLPAKVKELPRRILPSAPQQVTDAVDELLDFLLK